MNDTVLDLINIRQPLRALMYEKLIWKHLLGIGLNSSFAGDAADIRAFSYHTSGNIQTILGVIGFLVIVEGIAIDFFVATKSTKAAIILGVVHLAMLIYAIALVRASNQRPVYVSEDGILVRVSLLYCCWIPKDAIDHVVALDKEVDRVTSSDVLWCALGDQPNVLIELNSPQNAVLPFGIIRRPKQLFLYIDSPAEFVCAVG